MIRVAVIGAGHWGPHLIRNFLDLPESWLEWIVDRDPARLAQVGMRYPVVRTSANAADALDDDSVDAVVVATPVSTHHGLVKEALLRGKHVLVEKPIASTVEESIELCELAQSAGVVLMVGHVFVFNGAVRYVKRYIDEGGVGRIYYIASVRTNLGPIRMDTNAAWDLASHDVSIVNHWLDGAPVAASAVGRSWINAGIEDAVFATLRYPGDVVVNLHVSWLNPRKARDITVVGETHMLTVDDMNLTEPVRIYDKGVAEERTVPVFADTFASFRASIREGDVVIPRVALGEPLKAECEHFLECVAHGKEPITGGRQGLAVVRALAGIQESVRRNGLEVTIPS